MAEKRMFTQKIVDSDAFLDMPLSTQALYFHLNMRADDDGFVNSPKRIQRTIGASEDDLKLLIAKRFLICFENGVIVIKHWRMHNTLRKDRYNPTQYQEELKSLEVKDNNAYTEKQPDGNQLATTWQPDGNQLVPQYSIGKYSIDQYSVEEYGDSEKSESDSPPKKYGEFSNVSLSDDELANLQTKFPTDWKDRIESLSAYMSSTGKTYKSHYATILNWARSDKKKDPPKKTAPRSYDLEAYERMVEKEMNPPETAGDNEEIRKRMEDLQKRIGANERTG